MYISRAASAEGLRTIETKNVLGQEVCLVEMISSSDFVVLSEEEKIQ